MRISCPACGEADDIAGHRSDDGIVITCGRCGEEWLRDTTPTCPTCGRTDLRRVPLAILENGRGTQLSVVGTRPVDLCPTCDVGDLDRWQRNRPNPLWPAEVPNQGP